MVISPLDRLREALNAESDSQLAEMLGVPQPTLATWRIRGMPSKRIIAYADRYLISEPWLLRGEGPMRVNGVLTMSEPSGAPYAATSSRPLRIIEYDVTVGTGSAGVVVVTELPIGTYVLDQSEIERMDGSRAALPPNLDVFTVLGESMEPDFSDGDRVVTERFPEGTTTLVANGLYIFRLENLIDFKQVERLPDNQLRLSPRNPHYTSYTIDLNATVDFEILARVRAKFKRY